MYGAAHKARARGCARETLGSTCPALSAERLHSEETNSSAILVILLILVRALAKSSFASFILLFALAMSSHACRTVPYSSARPQALFVPRLSLTTAARWCIASSTSVIRSAIGSSFSVLRSDAVAMGRLRERPKGRDQLLSQDAYGRGECDIMVR